MTNLVNLALGLMQEAKDHEQITSVHMRQDGLKLLWRRNWFDAKLVASGCLRRMNDDNIET